MTALLFQGGVILRTFVPDSAMFTDGQFTLKQLRLSLVNEINTDSYTGPRLHQNYIISSSTDL